jgi:hypothetical protein
MSAPYVPHATYDEFRNAVNGHGYDLDGFAGYQCWDGVDLLYEQTDIGQYLYTGANFGGRGYAKECWTYIQARALNGSGHFTAFTGAVNIKKGDILVFNTYSGWYGTAGHIGFANEDYNGTDYISLLSQNFGSGANPTTGKPFNIMNAYLGTAFLGGFRYDGWGTTPPTPPTTSEHRFPWVLYARKFRTR